MARPVEDLEYTIKPADDETDATVETMNGGPKGSDGDPDEEDEE